MTAERSDGGPQSTNRARVEIGGVYLPPQLERTLQGKSHLCIPFLGIVQPQSQFPHSCVCEQFIYSQDQSTYFPAAEYADGTWNYKNLSQICKWRNWKREHYNSVLEITVSFLGKHKREPDIYIGFSPAFLCSVHHNFVRDGIEIVKESALPTLTRPGWFFLLDVLYARQWPLPLCVYSLVGTEK